MLQLKLILSGEDSVISKRVYGNLKGVMILMIRDLRLSNVGNED